MYYSKNRQTFSTGWIILLVFGLTGWSMYLINIFKMYWDGPVFNVNQDALFFIEHVRSWHKKAMYDGKERYSEFMDSDDVLRVEKLNSAEFYNYLRLSVPVIITNHGPCTTVPWTMDHIRKVAGNDEVGIEVASSNRFYNNKDLTKHRMLVSQFLDTFQSKDRKKDYYLAEESIHQTPALAKEIIPPDFAEFLEVDRTQLWVGAGGQIAPLHHDDWENILCQIKGVRRFILFDPLQADYLYPDPSGYFSQLDPTKPDYGRFPNFRHAKPIEIELHAGEMLFLPAFWWHQVHHHNISNIAINFWYFAHEIEAAFYHAMTQSKHNNPH